MIDDLFVIDAVTHAYNHTEDNFADPVGAGAISGLAYVLASNPPDPRYALSQEVYLSDWQVPDVANMLFRVSTTDVAVMHPLAISAYKDGFVSVEKAAEALRRYPDRFIGAYACVDPLDGRRALESLAHQVETLQPMGLKLYPHELGRQHAGVLAHGRSQAHLPALREGRRARAAPRRDPQGRTHRAVRGRRRLRPQRPGERRDAVP